MLGADAREGKRGADVMVSSVARQKRQPAKVSLFGFEDRDRGPVEGLRVLGGKKMMDAYSTSSS